LFLQPLVENGVIHGVEPVSRPCTVSITARILSDASPLCLLITVQDDDAGFDPVKANGDGLGLANIRERLRIVSRDATLSITSYPDQGACVVIQLPVQ